MDLLPNHDELLQAETLTEKAYRALEEEIVTLRIPPGTWCPRRSSAAAWVSAEPLSVRRCSVWPASGWS